VVGPSLWNQSPEYHPSLDCLDINHPPSPLVLRRLVIALAGVGYLPGVSAGLFDLTITRLVFGLLITIGVTAWAIDQLRGHLRENLVKA
jgi:hypothetical protein